MNNRTFVLSDFESTWLKNNKPDDWGILKNRFSGRRLFSYNYFNLFMGDTSVLDNNKNKWLIENIVNYAATKQDKNFIPGLKKIAADYNLDEGIRQRSVMILEMPWVEKTSFVETRTPQTSEILKLLKINSIESKKLAICMIGKYKLTDMLHEVADNLNIPGLEVDSASVLLSFRKEVGNELKQLYLKSSGNINSSKAILRILYKTGVQENITFLYERLWSNSKEIKELALDCLIDCSFKVPAEDKGRINQLINEICGLVVWIFSVQMYLKKAGNEFLKKSLNEEIIFWKKFLFNLLFITFDSGIIQNVRNESSDEETEIGVFSPELFNIIFDEPGKQLMGLSHRSLSDIKKLKRLNKLFPGEIPDFQNLDEDLLNRSYNQITIWTRACTLRGIKTIENKNLSESVVALIFSPEEILREEAAKLLARSSRELYLSVSQRIPVSVKYRLDKIINNEADEKELLFEKTVFLSSLFPEIPMEKLLFLAKEMMYIKQSPEEYPHNSAGVIVWTLSPELTNTEVKVFFEDDQDFKSITPPHEKSFLYLLSLKTVEEFHYLFPEHSFSVLKYIDDKEYQ
jgi:hypothetical protein